MIDLQNKKGIIFGVANERSIAWSCAEKIMSSGAEVGFGFLGDAQKKRIKKLLGNNDCFIKQCDVSNEKDISSFFKSVKKNMGKIDFIIHSIAYTSKESLQEPFSNTNKDNFVNTMVISAYSLISICRYAKDILNNPSSVISMSYYGAEKVIPNYNIMGVAKSALESINKYLSAELGQYGIRCNCISPGAMKTLAARAIPGLHNIIDNNDKYPLGRTPNADDVADTSLFLISDLSSAITGETIYVDCGFNILGV